MIDFNEEYLEDLIHTLKKAKNCKKAYYKLCYLQENQVFIEGFDGKYPIDKEKWLQHVHEVIVECIKLIEGNGNE